MVDLLKERLKAVKESLAKVEQLAGLGAAVKPGAALAVARAAVGLDALAARLDRLRGELLKAVLKADDGGG